MVIYVTWCPPIQGILYDALKSGQWAREWLSKPAFAAWNMEIIVAFAVIQAKKRRRSNSTESNKIIYYELFAEQHRFIIKNLELRPLVLRIKLSLKMNTVHWELVAGLTPWRIGFDTQSIQVGFGGDEVALRQVHHCSLFDIKCSAT
jgi:hypothetical protein